MLLVRVMTVVLVPLLVLVPLVRHVRQRQRETLRR
jgi:hypothetical protein